MNDSVECDTQRILNKFVEFARDLQSWDGYPGETYQEMANKVLKEYEKYEEINNR